MNQAPVDSNDAGPSSSFIAYRALPHLNNKHTIFARLIDDPTPSSTTLNKLEMHPVDSNTNRPTPELRITDVTIFVDPFEGFLERKRREQEAARGKTTEVEEEEDVDHSRRAEDERMTWTGKRVRGAGTAAADGGSAGGGVGRYLKAALAERADQDDDEIVEYVDEDPAPEPRRKKVKSTTGGGFGDFSSW